MVLPFHHHHGDDDHDDDTDDNRIPPWKTWLGNKRLHMTPYSYKKQQLLLPIQQKPVVVSGG